MLKGKTVLLGVTGSIAAYKIAGLASMLKKQHADITVLMTQNATNFINPITFETLTGNKCLIDTFDRNFQYSVEHVALAKRADIVLIAPASANVIGKIANGIADDMLSTTVMATRAPVLVAPAMNTGMWENAAVQQNVKTLRARGVEIVAPVSGHLACGDNGAGKLEDVAVIAERACELLFAKKDMEGLRVMVTAGPSREALDPVRYISNRSSGKMGYAIAQAAQKRGAEVTLLSGPVAIEAPQGVKLVPFTTTQELLDRASELAREQDLLIQAAAPADYRAKEVAPQKIKKQGGEPMTFTLVENPDVAATLGKAKRSGQVFVGFAAETNDVLAHARDKLARKNLDMIVANDVTRPGAGFDVDTNIVTLITKDGQEALPMMSKAEVAQRILDRALALRRE